LRYYDESLRKDRVSLLGDPKYVKHLAVQENLLYIWKCELLQILNLLSYIFRITAYF